MVNNHQMEELSILELSNKYNFIVPEIQREYVWGQNFNQILDSFFEDISAKYRSFNELTNESFEELKKSINPTLINNFNQNTLRIIGKEIDKFQSKRSLNIGFIYSYKPNYYIFNDSSEDVYLIDGQQRFTTLFITLFYFSIVESRSQDFKNIFRINLNTEKIGFDYRVRAVTHNFLIDLISHTEDLDDLKDINNKTWFLSEYNDDTSIKGLLGVIFKLNTTYQNFEKGYFDFLLNHVKFWHFKTEETSQGEELYITMNSRGRSLSENEILRAKLFEKLSKNEVRSKGQNWERWQDFFWSKRGNNENSDNGFNEFLRWVQILNMVNFSTIDTSNEGEEDKDKKAIIEVIKWNTKGQKLDSKYLLLDEIERYFKAVEYLFNDFSIHKLQTLYPTYFNKDILDINWLCPPNGKTIEQKDCFRLLPVIYFIKLLNDQGKSFSDIEVYRVLRYFYNLNAIESVNKSPNVACINAIKLVNELVNVSNDIADLSTLNNVSKTLLSEEEKYKFWLYKRYPIRTSIEQEFWEAEDFKLNSGRIGHIIQASFETMETIDFFKYDIKFLKIRVLDFILDNFILIKKKYFILNNNKTSNTLSGKVWGFLIPTTYYSVSNYRENWILNCETDDYVAQTSKEFLKMVLEIDENGNRDQYLENKAKKIFSIYSSSKSLNNESDLKIQLFCYFILLSNLNFWSWAKGKNFGCYDKSNDTEFLSLFSNKFQFQQYDKKWGGAEWRNVDSYLLINDIDYLQKIENATFWDTKS